jgi:drug/metabolite transporter (DMT)-like permease
MRRPDDHPATSVPRRPLSIGAATLDRLRLELGRSRSARGVALALVTAIISGFAIFINSYAVKEFDSPTVFATFKNALVGAALLALLLRPDRLAEARRQTPKKALGLLLLGLIGGGIPFVLFFEGLARVDSGNAAFLHKTLFVWVAILAVIFLRERLGRAQLGALGLLFLAQWMLGDPGTLLGTGVAMVFGATLLWACEVTLARRLLSSTSSGLAASGRMTLGAVLLLGYLAISGRIDAAAGLTAIQWAWIVGTSAILLAYVTTWYAALKLAPATAVTCVLTVGAPITAALNVIAGRATPTSEQLVGYAILLVAVLIFTTTSIWRTTEHREPVPSAVGGL